MITFLKKKLEKFIFLKYVKILNYQSVIAENEGINIGERWFESVIWRKILV